MTYPLALLWWALTPGVAVLIVVSVALVILIIVATFSGGRP